MGNTVVVFAAQVLGYDEYLLLGYDYCWGDKDNYYAFKDSEKRYRMKHINLVDLSGRLVNTSQNLLFSSRWLSDYYSKILRHQTRIYNCSGQGILRIPEANLIKKLKNAKIRQLHPVEKHNIMQSKKKQKEINSNTPENEKKLLNILKTYNIANIIINYIPQEAILV